VRAPEQTVRAISMVEDEWVERHDKRGRSSEFSLPLALLLFTALALRAPQDAPPRTLSLVRAVFDLREINHERESSVKNQLLQNTQPPIYEIRHTCLRGHSLTYANVP